MPPYAYDRHRIGERMDLGILPTVIQGNPPNNPLQPSLSS